jgi:hypothetical protein
LSVDRLAMEQNGDISGHVFPACLAALELDGVALEEI